MIRAIPLETARRQIGTVLVVLLIAIVLFGFAMLFRIDADSGSVSGAMIAAVHSKDDADRLALLARLAAEQSKADADRLALFLNIVFGPVVTLLGSVTGYYFGSKRRD